MCSRGAGCYAENVPRYDRAQQLNDASDYSAVRLILFFILIPLAACTTVDPLYCDANNACTDPARPFCDLAGEYPASNGVGKTCIPSPDDAGPDDGDDDDGADGDGADGIPDAGNEADAGAPADAAAPCSWSRFTKLANINSSLSEGPGSLDAEGLSIRFSRSEIGATNGALHIAERESTGEVFGDPVLIDELDDPKQEELDPEISPSGLEIFYRLSSGSSIQTATRTTPTGDFGPSEPTGLTGFSPSLSGDGLALYYVDTSTTVQRVTRKAVGSAWSSPETVLPSDGYFGVDVSPDELRLLLTINPFLTPDTPYLVAERISTDEPFGAPVPLNDEILLQEGADYFQAHWDGSQKLIVAGVDPEGDGGSDLFYSSCQ
jgi:hypothetical protein